MLQQGHARDLLTLANVAEPVVLAEDRFAARLNSDRKIIEISAAPGRPGMGDLAGARVGGQLRAAIAEVLPGERENATPLYLLLDDIAGSSLVGPWAWALWTPNWQEMVTSKLEAAGQQRSKEGVCIAFRPGGRVLEIRGAASKVDHMRKVHALDGGSDPFAWHDLTPRTEVAATRARRIDVWIEGDDILVESYFRDSAISPAGEHWAVHEYLLSARADRATQTLQAITAEPRILPHGECPEAILNMGRMVGTPLREMRQAVLSQLARIEGCTHLNDMMRSLAEVPQLSAALVEAQEAEV
ncbi:MAG: DUF2889 domain-containing protein [Novosphingobium sp.]